MESIDGGRSPGDGPADGREASDETFQRCAGVFLVRGESVLLGKRSTAKHWMPGVWDVIGGRLEHDGSVSELPVAAACREVNEELGVVVKPEDLHRLETIATEEFELTVFAASRWTGTPRNVAVDEHDEVTWLDSAALGRLELADPALAGLAGQAIDRCRSGSDRP